MLLEILIASSVAEAVALVTLYRSKQNLIRKAAKIDKFLTMQTKKEEALQKEVLDLLFKREYLFLDSAFLTIQTKKVALALVDQGLLYIEGDINSPSRVFKMTDTGREFYNLMY